MVGKKLGRDRGGREQVERGVAAAAIVWVRGEVDWVYKEIRVFSILRFLP